jgi:putative membrane protein
MNIIIKLLATAVTAYFLAHVLNGVHLSDFKSALIFAVVLGCLNIIVKPIISILALPITILTLGLFSLVINAIIVLLTDYFIDGIRIDGFLWAFLFSILLSIITSVLGKMLEPGEK